MDAADFAALRDDLETVPVPGLLVQLSSHTIVAINGRGAELLGRPAGELVGTDIVARIHPDERVLVEQADVAMAAHVMDGCQVRRRILRPDGSEPVVEVWGRRIEAPGGPYGFWIASMGSPAYRLGETDRSSEVVLALTDHDWQLDYVRADASLLGGSASELVGLPVMGFVHPSVATEFLPAAARAVGDRIAVTTVTRLRMGRGRWVDRQCLMVPMCEHDPPRLGLVVTAPPSAVDRPAGTLEAQLHHAAREARALDALQILPSILRSPGAPELTTKQLQVLSRLVAGDDIRQFADALYISDSTVRNHLTAIYRRFGVHSQGELLSAFLRAARGGNT